MARRKTLSDAQVAALQPRATRYALPDPEQRGHYVRVSPTAKSHVDVAKSYVAVAVNPATKKQAWVTLGSTSELTIEAARARARDAIKRIKAGDAATERPTANTFAVVAGNWLKRVVEGRHRTEGETRRVIDRYLLPRWGDRPFVGIKRRDLAELLDHVEDDHGARQADVCLTVIRSMANWYTTRDDDYVSPVARGMRRSKSATRDRILSDDEIRLVWHAAEGTGFGNLCRFALITGQRRQKLATVRWEDIVDGEWRIPTEAREKGNAEALPLPHLARAAIEAQPRLVNSPYVFAGRGNGPFNSFSVGKERLDAMVLAARKKEAVERGEREADVKPLPVWTVHDLRRTNRSLMARAGVAREIAERVLGHAVGGVEAIYDRHRYTAEKGKALATVARLIEQIVNPTANTNVVPLRQESVTS